jgi:hypothetical protein
VAAIKAYKAGLGFFPPDHVLQRTPLAVDSVTNQLVYELTGTIYNPTNKTYSTPRFEAVSQEMIRKLFGTEGFKNAVPAGQKPKEFLRLTGGFGSWEAHDSPDVNVLKPNFYWEGLDWEVMARFNISPWRYNSSRPSHNPDGFDLWVEVQAGDKRVVIGNWPEAE